MRRSETSRIAGVSAREAGPLTRIAYFFTGRQFVQLVGRTTLRILEPLELHAHVPRLMRAYGGIEQATAKVRRVDWVCPVYVSAGECYGNDQGALAGTAW